MYVITFYSFKGGVGRTMALVNAGAELARRGRKVLLVDFDLEAPGLSTYDLLRPRKPHPGIVEYVDEFRRTRRSPLVTDFLYEVTGKKAKLLNKKGGRLWVMPAGRGDADYRAKLNALNWRTLYQDEEGFLLFEDTKLQWEAELKPDYVLIDARTGHTDIEGICTRQLADAVVVVFYPNEQNLAGLREVCKHIRAEEGEGLKKRIEMHFVAANVPDLDDEDRILRRQLRRFSAQLTIYRAFPPKGPLRDLCAIHRHESLQMMDQPVFVLERPHSRLAREYRGLANTVIMENPVDPEGARLYLRGIGRDRELRMMWPVSRPLSVGNRLIQIESQFKDNPVVLRRAAKCYRKLGEFDLALRPLDRILVLCPNSISDLFDRARCRQRVRDNRGAAQDFLAFLRAPRNPNLAGQAVHELQTKELTVLRELIDLSFESFVEALDAPSVRENRYISGPFSVTIWLNSAAEFLLREKRWADATRYLEARVPALWSIPAPSGCMVDPEYFEAERMWYLAMAYWGKTETVPVSLSEETLEVLQKVLARYPNPGPTHLQRLSLLAWATGDAKAAIAYLDRASEQWNAPDGTSSFQRLVSDWTFRKASLHELAQHCAEQRRMIRGEAVRPAFLGSSNHDKRPERAILIED